MIPILAWPRARAASTSTHRERNASSPNTSRIGAVPNMSANMAESRELMAILARKARLRAAAGSAREIGLRPGGQTFERRETGLVLHLRAVGDPIAQIDM